MPLALVAAGPSSAALPTPRAPRPGRDRARRGQVRGLGRCRGDIHAARECWPRMLAANAGRTPGQHQRLGGPSPPASRAASSGIQEQGSPLHRAATSARYMARSRGLAPNRVQTPVTRRLKQKQDGPCASSWSWNGTAHRSQRPACAQQTRHSSRGEGGNPARLDAAGSLLGCEYAAVAPVAVGSCRQIDSRHNGPASSRRRDPTDGLPAQHSGCICRAIRPEPGAGQPFRLRHPSARRRGRRPTRSGTRAACPCTRVCTDPHI
jgi:hypothetical protein